MSETRSETARANGRKSRGPTTPEGKRRSSLNALTARTMVVCGEDAERLAAIREAYIRDFAPQTQLECDLLDQIVAARWRLERAWLVEAALLDLQELEGREAVDAAFEGIEDATRLAIAFRELSDKSSALSLVHQYESRLSRSFDRALRNFRDLRTRPLPPPNHTPPPTNHAQNAEKRTQEVSDSKGMAPASLTAPQLREQFPETQCRLHRVPVRQLLPADRHARNLARIEERAPLAASVRAEEETRRGRAAGAQHLPVKGTSIRLRPEKRAVNMCARRGKNYTISAPYCQNLESESPSSLRAHAALVSWQRSCIIALT